MIRTLSACFLIFSLATPHLAFASPGTVPQNQVTASGKCASLLTRFTTRAANAWSQFRSEVQRDGIIRYVLAPRAEPYKFSAKSALMNPALDFPIEVISFLRWNAFSRPPLRKRSSLWMAIPAGFLTYSLAFGYADSKTNEWALSGLEQSVDQDLNGAAYAAEWVVTGTLSPYQGMQLLEDNHKAFLRNLEPLRLRLTQFQELGLWTADQAAIANRALDQVRDSHSPDSIFHDKALLKLLLENADFASMVQSLPAESQFTASLLIEPVVQLYGKPDAYWLSVFFAPFRRGGFSIDQIKGLESLEKIYSFHQKDLPLATVIKLVADTLSDPKAITAKQARAEVLGLPRNSSFLFRADIPLFSLTEDFVDLSMTRHLASELDRWQLILTDPRFANDREAWRRGEISDITVLMRLEIKMRALSQIYAVANSQKQFDQASACTLIYGAGTEKPSNPLFSRLQHLSPAVQNKIAGIYFSAYLESAKLNDAAAIDTLMSKARDAEQNLLASGNLPSVPACPH